MNSLPASRRLNFDEFEPFDLGYRNCWTDKFRPTAFELKQMIHLRFMAIALREFGTRLEGKWLVINPGCGDHTEDEARLDRSLGPGSGNYEREGLPLPEGFWSWGEFILGIIEATGMVQRAIAQRIGCSCPVLSSYLRRGIRPSANTRIKLIELAKECDLLQGKENGAANT